MDGGVEARNCSPSPRTCSWLYICICTQQYVVRSINYKQHVQLFLLLLCGSTRELELQHQQPGVNTDYPTQALPAVEGT